MKHNSRTPKDGTHVGSPSQTDWPLDQIKELALKLYVRFPFDEEDRPEGWKDLVRGAFIDFDNLDEACKEILKERSEDREAEARQRKAYKELPSVAPFERAVRFITGEKQTKRARSKLEKVLSYEARIVPWEDTVSPKLPLKETRQIEAQLKTWQQNGIPRGKAIRLQTLFDRYWPRVVAEQNSAKVRKHAKRNDKRRGAKPPDLRKALTPFGKK